MHDELTRGGKSENNMKKLWRQIQNKKSNDL